MSVGFHGAPLSIYATCKLSDKGNQEKLRISCDCCDKETADRKKLPHKAMSASAGFDGGPLSWLNWNVEMFFFCGGKKTRETRENPWGKARANNKLNTHRTLDQNRIWTTLVGGWSSRHCSTHAPTLLSCYCLVLICAWFPLHLTSNIASIIVVYFYLLHSKQTEPCC